jgi:hypothetical protein
METNQERAAIMTIRHRSTDEEQQYRGQHRHTLGDPYPFRLGVQLPNYQPGKEHPLHADSSEPRRYTDDEPLVRIDSTSMLVWRTLAGSGLLWLHGRR